MEMSNFFSISNNYEEESNQMISYSQELIDLVKIQQACQILGNPKRMEMFCSQTSGALLYERVKVDGGIPLATFLQWWIEENYAEKIKKFMFSSFNGAELVERPTNVTFRFKLPQQNMSLSNIFERFESQKVELHISSYSVGQTTLEQVFNYFASCSDNPEINITS